MYYSRCMWCVTAHISKALVCLICVELGPWLQPTLILWELDGCCPSIFVTFTFFVAVTSLTSPNFMEQLKMNCFYISFQESQKQVQELLNDSSGAEMSRLKIQLQQSIASKSVTEQLCETLQVENDDHADCCLIFSFLKWFSLRITCHISPSFIFKAHVNFISLVIAKSHYFKNVVSNLSLFTQKSN